MFGFYVVRNKGLLIVKGGYVVFIDVDCVLDEKWLEELVNCVEK